MIFDVLFKVIGGLGIFLFGMENMSGGLQKIAGDRLRKIIAALTSNRFIATFIGVLLTAIVQSSSVTTVMVVGFVNASLMTLSQALGVILGANIGTTVTGWILVLKIGKYGLPLVGIGAIIYMFVKSDRKKTKALTLMGFGMIFLGLELMKDGLHPLRSMPQFVEMFHKFNADTVSGMLLAACVGALMTSIVQSSSATLGITIALATQGLLDGHTAVALVLGENVGTTITAVLASIGANANAKRAAYAHTIVNVVGVTWVLSIFPFYLKFLGTLADPTANIARYIATAHTMFNVTNVIIFLPLITFLAKLLEKFVSEKEVKVVRVTHLDKRMLETPSLAIEQVKKEIFSTGHDILDMMNKFKETLQNNYSKNHEYVTDVFSKEEKIDLVQKEISEINSDLLALDMEHALIDDTGKNHSICDEYESVSDYIERLMKSHLKLNELELELNSGQKNDLAVLHEKIFDFFKYVNEAYNGSKKDVLLEAMKKSGEIVREFKNARNEHLNRMAQSKTDVRIITNYLDMINSYRKINEHTMHAVEAMVGEK